MTIPDPVSDGLMFLLTVATMLTFAHYAWQFRHIWLGACLVPLGWLAWYYFLQVNELDTLSHAAMRDFFRPTIGSLLIFLTLFVARDRVDRVLLFAWAHVTDWVSRTCHWIGLGVWRR